MMAIKNSGWVRACMTILRIGWNGDRRNKPRSYMSKFRGRREANILATNILGFVSSTCPKSYKKYQRTKFLRPTGQPFKSAC